MNSDVLPLMVIDMFDYVGTAHGSYYILSLFIGLSYHASTDAYPSFLVQGTLSVV